MKKGIIARKIGMTQVFTEKGNLLPVTVLEAGPCVVTQIKTVEKEGYNSIQMGFSDAKAKQLTKPEKGHFDKVNIAFKKYLREFRLDDISSYKVGDEIKADTFNSGDKIDVTGISKGKGFQGNIKKYGQSRGPMAHGSKYHRGVGSLSSATTPGKVKKGRGLPSHMGHIRVTTLNLEVVKVDLEKNVILVKGAVPGPKGTIILVRDSVKA